MNAVPLRPRPRRLRALRSDRGGVALIEFAFVLPILLVLYLGGFQLFDAIACYRKVTISTRSIADLVSQNTTGETSANEVDIDLAAAGLVMLPYSSSNAVLGVTEFTTDSNGISKVVWSRAENGEALTPGTVLTVPPEMKIAGTYFLYAEVTYDYQPPAGFGFIKPIKFSDDIYMLPRNTNKIDCSDCNSSS